MKYQEDDINQKSEKVHWKTLNCFTSHEKLLFKKQQKQLVIHFVIKLPIKLWGFHKQNKGERVSSSQNEHTFQGGRGCLKMNKGKQGKRGVSNLGNLEQTYFLNVPSTNLNNPVTPVYLLLLIGSGGAD